ncbi:FecCD family ABC transporter permease [Acinetobacter sp. WCHAc010034]|uniref:FecCD family ABC transporter permease n=1 Tax=Acinetobacter sp. WCHAc010034 TaxID=1879049 RepID=UPI00083AA70A|nr:iron ABC transporter permease [Acinetobacter sp. WCHAc010034]
MLFQSLSFKPLFAFPALAVLTVWSITYGAGSPNAADSFKLLWHSLSSLSLAPLQPLLELRIPRTLAALLVGAALSISGVILQNLLKNPLADSGLIGINSGASLAVVIAVILQLHGLSLFFWAIFGAFISALLVFALTPKNQADYSSLTRLVLAGLAIASTFQGLMAALLLKFQNGLDEYRFWVLGSLNRVEPQFLLIAAGFIAVGIITACLIIRPLALSLVGDQLAQSLGLNLKLLELACIFAVVLLTGSAVALTGPIAFLGLIAPYFARAIGAVSIQQQLLYSGYFGMALLLAADILARTVVQPFEAPVSILLTLLGAPVLIWMVRQNNLQNIVQLEK